MTGFGRASSQVNDSCILTVEMKSVNHRFLDITLKMPKQFNSIEDKVKKLISQIVKRGRIDVFVNIEGEPLVDKTIYIDWDLLQQFVQSLEQIKEKFSLVDNVSLKEIITLGEGIEIRETPLIQTNIEDALIDTIEEAALQLDAMRKAEGKELANDLSKRLVDLTEIAASVKKIAPSVVEQYRKRIEKRVSEYVSGTIDENRILTEVAIFADKADITEELTRIHSHIQQFTLTLGSEEPIGRKLDFLVQELNREVNTIGSKANDGTIAKNVVEMKSIIEKLKEQVQNIE